MSAFCFIALWFFLIGSLFYILNRGPYESNIGPNIELAIFFLVVTVLIFTGVAFVPS